jgi:uncharacterized protein (TIGR03084 family)
MLPQADDFKAECDALYALLKPLRDEDFAQPTLFKSWTINDVLGHLHIWNWAAHMSLVDEPAFTEYLSKIMHPDLADQPLREREKIFLSGQSGQALLEEWHSYADQMAASFRDVDPKQRLKWAGPDMSARSSVTARLMETWAHAQAVYDALGVDRAEKDHIQNIVILGVNTFSWTYATRRETPPGPLPYLALTAPSGAVWEFGEPSETDCIKGDAVEFCRVVTQVRNIADTNLDVRGAVATDWMSKAQCFAGPPETPPAAGARHRAA